MFNFYIYVVCWVNVRYLVCFLVFGYGLVIIGCDCFIIELVVVFEFLLGFFVWFLFLGLFFLLILFCCCLWGGDFVVFLLNVCLLYLKLVLRFLWCILYDLRRILKVWILVNWCLFKILYVCWICLM